MTEPRPRARLVLSQLIEQMRMPAAPAQVRHFSRLRNFIVDVTAEGRRKATINLIMEADAGAIRARIEALRAAGQDVSLTSYIAACFVAAIAEDKRMQACRHKRRLVIFDDVDLAVVVERDWDGATLPVFWIVRAAQDKSAADIHRELQAARTAPLGESGPMQAYQMWFFRLPRVLRRIGWFFVRRNPYWLKDVGGTVGLTSMGMFGSGAALVQPITPMTLTLSIGTIERKPVLRDGVPVAGEVIHLNLGADHAVVDGAPLMRFAERFKEILREGTLPAPGSKIS